MLVERKLTPAHSGTKLCFDLKIETVYYAQTLWIGCAVAAAPATYPRDPWSEGND